MSEEGGGSATWRDVLASCAEMVGESSEEAARNVHLTRAVAEMDAAAAACTARHAARSAVVATVGALRVVKLMGEKALVRQAEAAGAAASAAGRAAYSALTAISDLATALHAMRELATERGVLEAVVVGATDLFGTRHQNTVLAKSRLGDALCDASEYAAAREMYEEVLAWRKEEFGTQHQLTQEIKLRLGRVLSNLSEYAAAHEMCKEVLAWRREKLGTQHQDTQESVRCFAWVNMKLGSESGKNDLRYLSAARSGYEEVVAFRTEHFGVNLQDRVVTLGFRDTLAGILATVGELSAAREMFEEVIAELVGLLGPQHATTRKVVGRLGDLVGQMARKERKSSSRV